MIYYAWKKGLKGAYYLRSNSSTRANDVAVEPRMLVKEKARRSRDRDSEAAPGDAGGDTATRGGDACTPDCTSCGA